MGLNYVLDTNIVIYLEKGILAEPLPIGRYFISAISEIELLSFSALTPEEEKALQDLFADLTIVPVDGPVKLAAIRLRRANKIRVPDAIVAGTALALDAELLTNDSRLGALPGVSARKIDLQAS